MGLVTRCSGWCSGWFGTKGCLLTVLLIGCIVVSLIVAKWMTPTHEDHDLEIAVKSSLIFFFCLGILGMLCLLFCSGDNFSEDEHNENKEEGTHDINVYFLHRLRLLLLGIFAMGSVGHDLLRIVDIGQYLYLNKIKEDLDLKIASLLYACIKLVFVLEQICFIAHCWTYRCKSNKTRFILGLIFAANLCIWFYVLVSESLETWNNKSKSTPCENGNTKPSEMLESWQPYLYPLTMEFCLMASGLLGSMWGWNIKGITVVNDISVSPSTASVGSQSGTEQQHQADNSPRPEDDNESGDDEHTPFVTDENSNDTNPDRRGCCCKLTKCNKGKSSTCPEVFYIATLMSIALFVFAAENQDGLWTIYCFTYMFLHFVLLLCSVIVCCLMRKEEIQLGQFGPNQILLLVSTGALILLTLLELIPPLANISSLETCEIYLILTDFFLLISVFFQTLTLLKGWTKTDSDNPYLKRLFSIIAVLNLYMWFEDSIYAHQLDSRLYLKHKKFYDKMFWNLCKLILMPPCIFYRIHVAEMFGERFFKL